MWLDLEAFPSSCILCLSWKWLDTMFTIPHVPCFPCKRVRSLMVGAHWGPMVTPGISPQFRGSCSSWVQPVMCVKSTKMGICSGILLFWVKIGKVLQFRLLNIWLILIRDCVIRICCPIYWVCLTQCVRSRAVPLLCVKCSWTGWMELWAFWSSGKCALNLGLQQVCLMKKWYCSLKNMSVHFLWAA